MLSQGWSSGLWTLFLPVLNFPSMGRGRSSLPKDEEGWSGQSPPLQRGWAHCQQWDWDGGGGCYRDWAGPRSGPCPPPPRGNTIRGWGVAAPALCHADSTAEVGRLSSHWWSGSAGGGGPSPVPGHGQPPPNCPPALCCRGPVLWLRSCHRAPGGPSPRCSRCWPRGRAPSSPPSSVRTTGSGWGRQRGVVWLKDDVVSVTPLDVVKIRLQAQRTPFSKGNPARGRAGVCRHLPGRPAWQRRWWGVWGHREVAACRGPLVLTGSGGPARGAGLVLGSIPPAPLPRVDAEWGQRGGRQPPTHGGAGRARSARSGCSLCPLLPLCLSPCCSPRLPRGRRDPMGSAPPWLPPSLWGQLWGWSQVTR